MNMTLKKKIGGGFLALVLFTFLVSGVSFYMIGQMNAGTKEMNDNTVPLLLKTAKVSKLNINQVATLRAYLITGDEKYVAEYRKYSDEAAGLEDELVNKAVTEEGRKFAQEVKKLDDEYDKYLTQVVTLKKAGKDQEALAMMRDQATPVANALNAKLEDYMAFRQKQIGSAFENAQSMGNQARTTGMVIGVLALLVGAGIGVSISRAVIGALRDVTGDLNKLSKGDYSFKVPEASLARTDEIGIMAKAMDNMLKTMRQLIGQLSHSSEQLAASSEQLTASSEQAAQAANQVAESITDVAAGATSQLNAVDETTNVVEQLSAGIQTIAQNAGTVAATAQQTASAAQAGGEKIQQATGQMEQIEKTVEDSAQLVGKLGERSQEIGAIVDTISGIAGQTNLLALNAAIEAARAGEQGRGFAVVAEEVRKLAEQSQEAAKKIAELISEVRQDTDRAVAAMNDGTREVKTGTKVVDAAGKSFADIVSLIGAVADQVNDISAAIEQMTASSHHIVGSIKDINKISQESSDHTQSVSAATEEQLASMEEIASSSQALAKMAEELQRVVANFKV